jgi:hypothetical protein
VPGQTRWLYTCIESRVVRQENATTSLVYNRTNAPWPVADRDVVLETAIDAADSDPAQVRFQSVDDAAAPPVDGVVRMPRLVGAFTLTALAPARTQVVYQIDIDPGGALPGWLAQRTTRELPFETLRGLRRLVVGSPP